MVRIVFRIKGLCPVALISYVAHKWPIGVLLGVAGRLLVAAVRLLGVSVWLLGPAVWLLGVAGSSLMKPMFMYFPLFLSCIRVTLLSHVYSDVCKLFSSKNMLTGSVWLLDYTASLLMGIGKYGLFSSSFSCPYKYEATFIELSIFIRYPTAATKCSDFCGFYLLLVNCVLGAET